LWQTQELGTKEYYPINIYGLWSLLLASSFIKTKKKRKKEGQNKHFFYPTITRQTVG